MDESNNVYVSSRGILNSCSYHSITPHSSIRQLINYPDVEIINTTSNPTVYVCSSAIPHFVVNILSLIKTPFILVSGDCDETMPYDIMSNEQFGAFINHKLLLHWFCQNIVVRHDKITCMPIGLDYHTMQSNRVWGEITYHITTGKMGGGDYSRNKFLNILKKYNLIHNKHIPDAINANGLG